MKALIEKIKSLTKIQLMALALIVVGLGLMIPRAMGMAEFSKEAKYAVENNFAAGDVSPDLLRPWMTIRYISSAYAVPQEYIFTAANIQPRKETTLIALGRLNKQMGLREVNGEPELMNIIREAIIAYRKNPVATGLIERNVEHWMSVQYVANSTGIPADEIFKYLGIPAEGNAYFPIGFLSEVTDYPGGEKALIASLQKLVDEKGVKPKLP